MKKLGMIMFLMFLLIGLGGCGEEDPVLYINPEITEYSPNMSSTPGIPLLGVFTLDLKNSDLQFHWVAEEGTFLMWHNEGHGRIEDLGNDVMTNVHKMYWSTGTGESISEKSFTIYLSVEDIYTSEIIAETSIQIDQKEEGYFTIDE